MAGGLFELRKDSITGWWVAVVVDREFDPARFRRPAKMLGHEPADCANCHQPPGDGVRVRMLKPDAFTVAGTEREAKEAGHAEREPELGLVGDPPAGDAVLAQLEQPASHRRLRSLAHCLVDFLGGRSLEYGLPPALPSLAPVECCPPHRRAHPSPLLPVWRRAPGDGPAHGPPAGGNYPRPPRPSSPTAAEGLFQPIQGSGCARRR
jgi:hypothetical protein